MTPAYALIQRRRLVVIEQGVNSCNATLHILASDQHAHQPAQARVKSEAEKLGIAWLVGYNIG
jgi:hypothetical protein